MTRPLKLRPAACLTASWSCQIPNSTSVAVQKSASLQLASSSCGLLNQSHTRNNDLLVSFRFRSSQTVSLQNDANFGIRTLVSCICKWSPVFRRHRMRAPESDHLKAIPRRHQPFPRSRIGLLGSASPVPTSGKAPVKPRQPPGGCFCLILFEKVTFADWRPTRCFRLTTALREGANYGLRGWISTIWPAYFRST